MDKWHQIKQTISRKTSFIFMAMIAFITACGDDAPAPDFTGMTISAFIEQDPNFSLLASALELTALSDTLDSSGEFTFLIPSDKAFEKRGITSLDDLSTEEWSQLIKYHLTTGDLSLEALLGGVQESLLQDYYWLINEDEGAYVVNGTTPLLSSDILMANGRIHVLTKSLTPQQINVVYMAQNEGFTLFVKGLQKAGMDQMLAEQAGPYTLFIPSDEALTAYFAANGITEEDWLGFSTLNQFLSYFIVAGRLDFDDLTPGPRQALSGDTLFFSQKDQITWLNGLDSISKNGIQGGNGLIYGLDQVLTRPDRSLASIVSEGNEGNGYSEFKAAMIYVDLLDILEGTEPMTVFAPDNAAFLNWYNELGVSGYYEIEAPVLRETLLYHISPTRYFSQDLSQGQSILTMSPGHSIQIDSDVPTLNGIGIKENFMNQLGTNGVIHGLNGVLALPAQD